MSEATLRVEPIISFPREAVAGQSYLVTVDLRASGAWPFAEEEYAVYCMLEGGPELRSQALGAGAVVLHRFGGSYGAAQFQLFVGTTEGKHELSMLLVTGWGAPLGQLALPIRIVAEGAVGERVFKRVAEPLPGANGPGRGEQESPPEPLEPVPGPVKPELEPQAQPDWPIILLSKPDSAELYPNGIDAITGLPLLRIDAAMVATLAQQRANALPDALQSLYRARINSSSVEVLGTTAGIDQSRIEEARWALVINAEEDAALIEALWPLVEHRMRQMGMSPPRVEFHAGETAGAWYDRYTDKGRRTLRKEYWDAVPPVLIYRPGERTNAWLARHGVAQGPVEPRRGMPYYLLLVGRPGPLDPADQRFIPFDFQHELDIFWGVGRLCFSDPDGQHRLNDYAIYAERLVAYERVHTRLLRREIAYVAPTYAQNQASELSLERLVRPLVDWGNAPDNLAQRRYGFATRLITGNPNEAPMEWADLQQTEAPLEADVPQEVPTRHRIVELLREEAPQILFLAAQSVGFTPDDPQQNELQGALIMADWPGSGPVEREQMLTGEDVRELDLSGVLVCMHASYSLGWPAEDGQMTVSEQPSGLAVPTKGGPPEPAPLRLAPYAAIAQLPQQLLLSGALGVFGQVDRAWYHVTYRKGEAPSPFIDLLSRLMQGRQAGDATDQFNLIQAERAQALTAELEDMKFGKQLADPDLADLWLAYQDSRAFIWLGDPAVQPRIEGNA